MLNFLLLIEPECSLSNSQDPAKSEVLRNISYYVCSLCYDEVLLDPHATLKLVDHPLSDVRDCLFSTFPATLK
jgi:hypothetical protein